MSVIQSKCFSSPIKFPNQKPANSRVSYITVGKKTTTFRQKIITAEAVTHRSGRNVVGIPCRILHHPLEAELASMDDEFADCNIGIGIDTFFQGKNIFVTGATGLVGKVLVEKLLRSTAVGKIFVLIRAEDKEEAYDRLNKEIINSDLFKTLEEKHGKNYISFMKEKVIPIVGNICEPNLGMDSESVNTIIEEVDVIIESAASTTLNDRYDTLIDINTNAPQRLMRFAKSCKNIKLFAHISTAYVNGSKEGMLFEEALKMGENVTSISSIPPLDMVDEIRIINESSSSHQNMDITTNLKKLGQERAEYYGWYNAYHMTKAMGEMVLNEIKGDFPLLIIRPAVIESCFKEPSPGWIQGKRMYDPVIISYGKGQLPAYLADPKNHMDIIPVDMVANTTIAAMAKHGMSEKSDLNVYHVSSSDVNPLTFLEFFDIIHEYFILNPLPGSVRTKKMKFFEDLEEFSKCTRQDIWEQYQSINGVADENIVKKQCRSTVAYAERLCKMYEFAGFTKGRFHTGNTQKLHEEMSENEKLKFEIDATKINWRKYFQEIHIPGLVKHVL